MRQVHFRLSGCNTQRRPKHNPCLSLVNRPPFYWSSPILAFFHISSFLADMCICPSPKLWSKPWPKICGGVDWQEVTCLSTIARLTNSKLKSIEAWAFMYAYVEVVVMLVVFFEHFRSKFYVFPAVWSFNIWFTKVREAKRKHFLQFSLKSHGVVTNYDEKAKKINDKKVTLTSMWVHMYPVYYQKTQLWWS